MIFIIPWRYHPVCKTSSTMASGSLPMFTYRGVTYTFVDTQLQSLEDLKCPICLELVSDPVQTSCGHLFCGKCIKGIKQCPIDREDFTSTPDHFNKRRLRSFKVKCPNFKRGCSWQGDLGDAEEHMKGTCISQEVECSKGCGSKMLRLAVPDHLRKNCPLRDYRCPHCQLQGTYDNITTSHFTVCRDFPLTCPAGCRGRMARRTMATHLQQTCPMEFVECEYKILGCSELIRRRANDDHLADDKYHLKMAMKAQATMFSCMKCAFSTSFKTTPDISLLPLSFHPWLLNTPTCYPRPPWVFKLEGFQEKKEEEEEWFSDPVYSHFGGYKMCLNVDVNGCGDGEGTHVSVFVYLMRGDNDDNLKWPFKGNIKVSLLNQLEDGQHLTDEVWSPNEKIPQRACMRITERERAQSGRGIAKYALHRDLGCQDIKNQQFLKDDSLFFRLDCFQPKL